MTQTARFPFTAFVILLALATSFVTVRVTAPQTSPVSGAANTTQPDALDRIVAAKKLRCGYISYPPYFSKDPNTGKEQGLMVDILQNIADKMQVKLEWSYETTWATMFEDMKMDRFDAVCSSVWQNTERALQADFSTPILYNQIQAWVRTDDNRFDGNLAAINRPDITIPTLDGEMVEKLAKEFFPKAKTISLPQNALFSDVMTNVVTKKADIVFLEPQVAQDYLRANPGSLRAVQNVPAVAEFPVVIVLPKNSPRLKTVIDTAVMEIKSTPALATLLAKYGMVENVVVK
mgnify:CR=1 FL=1